MILPIFQPPLAPVKNKIETLKKGQTLITLLIFILVLITITLTSVSIVISNAQNTAGTSQTIDAYYAAEAGVEDAMLQLLRNPDYTGGAINVSQTATAVTTITHPGQYIVTSIGKSGLYTRIIRANLDYTNNNLTVISWQELFQ